MIEIVDAPYFTVEATPDLGKCRDKYALTVLPEIDCATLIPLCEARCCTLTFSLSEQDLDEHAVKWDYNHPYRIRQNKDGYCVHASSPDRRCEVYAKRPAPCRLFDCRTDRRIWVDFENRIPAAKEFGL